MRRIDYDQKEKYTGNTETHIAADAPIEEKYGNVQNAFEEGFASSHGLRGNTAATDGRIKHPENADAPVPDPVPSDIEDENPGLAES